jgi:hypothetical protein
MAESDYEDEKWVPDEALEAMTLEAALRENESSIERAKRLLQENVDVAAASTIWLARSSTNERIRLEAGKYIMERVLGRAGDAPATGSLDDLFDKLDKMNEMAAAQAQSGPHAADSYQLFTDAGEGEEDN